MNNEDSVHKYWENRRARAILLRRLRGKVEASPGCEQKLWNELLRRFWKWEGKLSVADAIGIMGLEKHPDLATQYANHLREKVKDTFRDVEPRLGIHITTQSYAIGVSEPPPEHWKQSAGLSIGLLLADATDWFVGDVIRGVTSECERRGYNLLVDVSNDDPQAEAKKIRILLGRTNGLLVVPVGHSVFDIKTKTVLRERDCVLIDRYLRDLPEVPCVHPDDISAGRRAGAYLRDCGCKRVIVVDQGSRSGSSFAITPLEDRVKGCKFEIGEQIAVKSLPAAGTDEEGGLNALQQFEKHGGLSSTDGILALTDRLAVGCRHYLTKKNLNRSVISIEGQPFGEFMEPPLVSIKFDNEGMGRRAAEILFEMLRGGVNRRKDLRHHYLVRAELLELSEKTGKREPLKIEYPDADSHYSLPQAR